MENGGKIMFNNFNLSDEDVIEILNKYDNLISKYSKINGIVNEDLKQEIIIYLYINLTKNREK